MEYIKYLHNIEEILRSGSIDLILHQQLPLAGLLLPFLSKDLTVQANILDNIVLIRSAFHVSPDLIMR